MCLSSHSLNTPHIFLVYHSRTRQFFFGKRIESEPGERAVDLKRAISETSFTPTTPIATCVCGSGFGDVVI